MDRLSAECWSRGLTDVGSALCTIWEEEKDAVDPRETWPTVRPGSSATEGEEGLGVCSAATGGVGVREGSGSEGLGGSSTSVDMLSRKPRD